MYFLKRCNCQYATWIRWNRTLHSITNQKTQTIFIFFSPQFLSSIKRNPFINSFRNTDIDFGCNQLLTLSITLNIPSSYQVESLPKSITVRAPDSSFFFRRISSSDSVRVFFTQTFEIKRPLFGKEEYAALQEFFKRIYALMAEEIILKKKK